MKNEFVQILILSALLILPVISIAGDLSDSVIGGSHLPNSSVNSENIYTPGLGEIMTVTQMRHAKLWFVGKAGNWKLADYELYELKEGFDNAVNFHQPVLNYFQITETPLEQLKTSISEKNYTRFNRVFVTLTNSCNDCHEATSFGFNVAITPATNPYTNQSFEIRH